MMMDSTSPRHRVIAGLIAVALLVVGSALGFLIGTNVDDCNNATTPSTSRSTGATAAQPGQHQPGRSTPCR